MVDVEATGGPVRSGRAGELEFRLLGPLELVADGAAMPVRGIGVRCILAMLLLSANEVVPTVDLIDVLWPEGPPATARTIVHGYISRLRKVLDLADRERRTELHTAAPGYLLRVEADRIDVHRARTLVAQADGAPPVDRARLLRQALELWRGPILGNCPESLRSGRCTELHELRLVALEERIDADLELGGFGDLIAELSALADAYPLRERLIGQLMRARYRAGLRADALATYHRLREQVVDELGIDPGPELTSLYERMLRDAPSLRHTSAAPASAVTPAQLPPTAPGFAGRDAELSTLDELVAARDAGAGSVVGVLTGAPGAGKTALALRWGHRVASDFPDGQLFAALRGFDPQRPPQQPGAVLTQFLLALGVAATAVPADLDQRTALFRSLLADRKVLVLLDDARNPDQVRPLLPGGTGSLVLVTSRRRLDGLAVREGARRIPVGELPTPSAIRLLRAAVPVESTVDDAGLVELAGLCGHLPLALRIAAARLTAEPQRGVPELVAELRDENRRLGELDTEDPYTSVRGAFDVSYRSLSAELSAAFRAVAVPPGQSVTPELVAAVTEKTVSVARQRLRQLAAAHLLTEPGADRFVPHDLVRLYARERLAAELGPAERTAACHRVVDFYLSAADRARRLLKPASDGLAFADDRAPALADRSAALAWFDAEWSNCLDLVATMANRGLAVACWRQVYLLHRFLLLRGHFEDGRDMVEAALAAALAAGDPLGEASMRNIRVNLALRLGEPDELLPTAERALAAAEESGDAYTRVRSLTNLLVILNRLDRWDDATGYGDAALELCRAHRLPHEEAIVLNNLAVVAQARGALDVALHRFDEVRRLHTELGDREYRATATINMGHVTFLLGDYARSERLCRLALELAGQDGMTYLGGMANLHLGDALAGSGRTAEAVEAWRSAHDTLHSIGAGEAVLAAEKLDAAESASPVSPTSDTEWPS